MGKNTITEIAGKIVAKKGIISIMDLFIAIGWLKPAKLAEWREGKIPYLERVITANLSKISRTMKDFRAWAIHSKLKPSITVYKHKGSKLRFSKTGDSNIEAVYSTHYLLQKCVKKSKDAQSTTSIGIYSIEILKRKSQKIN